MASPIHPPRADGSRAGEGRPEPGILCWSCRNLTPFPAEACIRCGAAFAGSHGGAYGDALPGRSVRATVSSPAAAGFAVPNDQRPATQDIVGAPASARAVSVSHASKASVPVECPVCGRASTSGERQCQCGVVFGDAATTFNCAECGSLLPVEADHCFVCGISVGASGTMYACPLCGATVSEDSTSCRCGARFAD